MRLFDNHRAHLLAIGLGFAFLPVESFLFVSIGGSITDSLVHSIVGFGLKPHVYWLMRGTNALIWFLILGFLFGVPLGLIAKGHVLRYWLVFVIAATGVNLILSFLSESSLGAVLLTWSFPEYWLYFVAVLCFASVTPWAHRRVDRRASAAP